jgi:hypothetical protein
VSDAAKHSYTFGQELATLDTSSQLLPRVVNALKAFEADNAFFVSGYFAVLFQRDQPLWEATLDDMAKDESLCRFVPEVTWRSGMTEDAALRLLALLETGRIGASALRMFFVRRRSQANSGTRVCSLALLVDRSQRSVGGINGLAPFSFLLHPQGGSGSTSAARRDLGGSHG